MTEAPDPKVTFGRDGAAHTANIFTREGHFMARARTPLLALEIATARARVAEVFHPEPEDVQELPIQPCDDCYSAEGVTHETWCPQGPGAMYS